MAWFGVASLLSSCFWLGFWSRPRLARLSAFRSRRHGGLTGRARASERGNPAMVALVRTYTGCWTVGAWREDGAWRDALLARSRITALGGSTFVSVGTPGARTPPDAAA